MPVDQAAFKLRLEAEHKRLQAELDQTAINLKDLGPDDPGALAEDNNLADDSSQAYEQEKLVTLQRSLQTVVDKINFALIRIEQGTYGKCGNCGKDIPIARLNALPYATLCIECQSKQEKR